MLLPGSRLRAVAKRPVKSFGMTQLRPNSEPAARTDRTASVIQFQDPPEVSQSRSSPCVWKVGDGLASACCGRLPSPPEQQQAFDANFMLNSRHRHSSLLAPNKKSQAGHFRSYRRHQTISRAIGSRVLETSRNMRACERHCPTWGTPQLPMTQIPKVANRKLPALALETLRRIDGLRIGSIGPGVGEAQALARVHYDEAMK